MFQRLLVPLDGSPQAERAIAVAASLARPARGTLLFFHLLTPARVDKGMHAESSDSSTGSAEREHAARQTEALEAMMVQAATSLATLADRYAPELAHLSLETAVAFGTKPPTFPPQAHVGPVDLLVLCGHREVEWGSWGPPSALSWLLGQSPVPLLVLNEHAPQMPILDGTRRLRLLVPLDGSLFAETALAPALHLLAQQPGGAGGELCLVHVLPPLAGGGEEERVAAPSQPDQQSALGYLQAVADRLRGQGRGGGPVEVNGHVSRGREVSRALLEVQADLDEAAPALSVIAMASHGREGVAQRLFETTTTPLLLVNPRVLCEHARSLLQPTASRR